MIHEIIQTLLSIRVAPDSSNTVTNLDNPVTDLSNMAKDSGQAATIARQHTKGEINQMPMQRPPTLTYFAGPIIIVNGTITSFFLYNVAITIFYDFRLF